MKYNLLVLNGGLSGSQGNSAHILSQAVEYFDNRFDVQWCNLAEKKDHERQISLCQKADAFLIATGTYWGSCSSVLQDFFERMTPTEGTDVWLGKPVGIIVTMHAAGAESVLSRLQLTLNMFGSLLPPMSAMTYSALTHEAIKNQSLQTETWQLSDLEIVCHNLTQAVTREYHWRVWPTDKEGYQDLWLREDD
ncbi:MAG: NAD(P)H-dependent oxidoreductase [Bdellovibrionales bacterium]|nr:NAD(P)H-dependent oxidoreductase [Bdellovibrionales bacterium]